MPNCCASTILFNKTGLSFATEFSIFLAKSSASFAVTGFSVVRWQDARVTMAKATIMTGAKAAKGLLEGVFWSMANGLDKDNQ